MLPGDASVDQLTAGAVSGDFGTSFRHQQPALPLVLERLPATLELAFAALLLAVAAALPLGVITDALETGERRV